MHDNEIFGVITYRRYAKIKQQYEKIDLNIKGSDCYICPETDNIRYTGRIDRNGYKYYSSKESAIIVREKPVVAQRISNNNTTIYVKN